MEENFVHTTVYEANVNTNTKEKVMYDPNTGQKVSIPLTMEDKHIYELRSYMEAGMRKIEYYGKLKHLSEFLHLCDKMRQ